MKYSEFSKMLKKLGMVKKGKGKGSHEKWGYPGSKKFTIVPRHGSKEITKGTEFSILKWSKANKP